MSGACWKQHHQRSCQQPFPSGTSSVYFSWAVQITQRRASSHLPVGAGHCCHLSGDKWGRRAGANISVYLSTQDQFSFQNPSPTGCAESLIQRLRLYTLQRIYFSVYLCHVYQDGRGPVTQPCRVGLVWRPQLFLERNLSDPHHLSSSHLLFPPSSHAPGPLGNSVV